MTDGIGQDRQWVVRCAQFDEAAHLANTLGQSLQHIPTDIQVSQPLEPSQRCRQRHQSIIMQVKEVRETVEIAEAFGKGVKRIMAEIEHAKAFQLPDPCGHFSQLVIGKHKRFEPNLLPHRFGHSAKPSLPQIEMFLLGH